MSNYTEGFSSVSGDTVDSTELETEFDAIATAIATKLDSDGSGTLTGALNFGSNKGTNVTDPTAAQDVASKNYVDTSVVVDYDAPVNSNISTIETLISTLNLTVPSSWVTYDVEVLATFTLDYFSGTNSGETQIDVRIRETNTSGAVVANGFDVMADTEIDGLSSCGAVFGYQVAETLTGSRTMVLTAAASANASNFQIQGARFKFLCRRTS